ncbi:trypsin-like serine protease [Bradyrhizobium sp. 44]|uniref:trypsin-like serine protease n=1 Tax=Bradyrhizobium sp. 44 TaxID=2782675 RepID=UPI001FFA3537|nr:trypsin-like serine protease [Bradyrhizobium sp. 44]MCK1284722.1 trypsin-like serine protease [Bradyrhizobium sp. 44]
MLDGSRRRPATTLLSAAALLLALGGISCGCADEIVMKKATPTGAGAPQVDGGTRQDVTTWPATLKYFLSDNFACTSTIVGSRTVITAAHCIAGARQAKVELGADTFPIDCTTHPLFVRDTLEADVALCYSSKDFPNNIGFENLDLRSTRIRVDSNLFLLGYGCRNVNTLAGEGELYGGSAKVFQLAALPTGHARTRGGVVICPGDSGGSAYLLAVDDQPINPRSIVGINSGYIAINRVSAITGLTGVMADFIRDWADDRKTRICGVHQDAQFCHDRFSP